MEFSADSQQNEILRRNLGVMVGGAKKLPGARILNEGPVFSPSEQFFKLFFYFLKKKKKNPIPSSGCTN